MVTIDSDYETRRLQCAYAPRSRRFTAKFPWGPIVSTATGPPCCAPKGFRTVENCKTRRFSPSIIGFIMEHINIIDTHTGGEPTRTTFHSLPAEVGGSVAERLAYLKSDGDWIRRAMLLEPRGCESMVGALVGPPANSDHTASLIFFNNTGYLGMCGHGLIGVVETMRYRDGLSPGIHSFETPAGLVRVKLHDDARVSFENVPSYRSLQSVVVKLGPEASPKFPSVVHGDVAYGGNWFFLVHVDELETSNLGALTAWCLDIRNALQRDGVCGINGAEIDHVELCMPMRESDLTGDSASASGIAPAARGGRNFVLCPGAHFDRSPCGTGTSAKLACLAVDGKLQPGEIWIQESIIGSRFEASYQWSGEDIVVTVMGRAYVTGEAKCVLDPNDPYRLGWVSASGQPGKLGHNGSFSGSKTESIEVSL